MLFDPSTLCARTSAGEAELATPSQGLSLGQRRVLNLLQNPVAVEELARKHRLEPEKLARDLTRLAELRLVRLQGDRRSPQPRRRRACSDSRAAALAPVVIGRGSRRSAAMPLAAGVIAVGWRRASGTALRNPAAAEKRPRATAPLSHPRTFRAAGGIAAAVPPRRSCAQCRCRPRCARRFVPVAGSGGCLGQALSWPSAGAQSESGARRCRSTTVPPDNVRQSRSCQRRRRCTGECPSLRQLLLLRPRRLPRRHGLDGTANLAPLDNRGGGSAASVQVAATAPSMVAPRPAAASPLKPFRATRRTFPRRQCRGVEKRHRQRPHPGGRPRKRHVRRHPGFAATQGVRPRRAPRTAALAVRTQSPAGQSADLDVDVKFQRD